jgi:hypothetical protein
MRIPLTEDCQQEAFSGTPEHSEPSVTTPNKHATNAFYFKC